MLYQLSYVSSYEGRIYNRASALRTRLLSSLAFFTRQPKVVLGHLIGLFPGLVSFHKAAHKIDRVALRYILLGAGFDHFCREFRLGCLAKAAFFVLLPRSARARIVTTNLVVHVLCAG